MNFRCQELVTSYTDWLREKISIESFEEICEITTPFLDRHNDHLQIFVQKQADSILKLTDFGYILRDLKMNGLEITKGKREMIFESILKGFGATWENDEIVILADRDNFPQRKHNHIQAMLAVNVLFVMSKSMVGRFFKDDVEAFLMENDIRFTPQIKFSGKSHFDQSFDFVIPASSSKPERIIKTINRPTRDNITLMIFAWVDIKIVRPPKSKVFSVLNDSEKELNLDVISAMNQYGINPLPWSKREEYVAELTG